MKKLLMIILCASIITPTFAFADKGSGRDDKNRDNKVEDGIHRSADHTLASTTPITVIPISNVSVADNVRNINGIINGRDEDNRHNEVKLRYFFCNSATGGSLVAVNEKSIKGNRSKWPTEVKGCIKLSGGFAKKLQRMMGGVATTTPPVATTTPPIVVDVTAPVISLLSVSSLTPTSATVSWTTNEIADGEVYFGTNNPVKSGIFRKVENKSLSTTHSFTLTGLTASTTYFYKVESRDGARNKVESNQQSFVTPAVVAPDTTAPVISTITSSASSTTATVAWNTNELANGKLWYGTSTPLTAFTADPAFTLAHSFLLTGLTASTTYSLLLESADSVGNVATTTASLVTTN